jgi:hypothetical protein
MANCLNCKKEFKERTTTHTYCSAYCQRKKSSLNYGQQKDYNPELNLGGEVWRPIDGYGGHYEVSNLGRLRSYGRYDKLAILKLFVGDRGYYRKPLYNKVTKKSYNFSIHRLVANAFIPNPDNKPNVNHIDGNKLNNKVENLEWVTQGENLQHAIKSGTLVLDGPNNPTAAFTKEQVIEIRELYSKGNLSRREIANIYGVSKSPIDNMLSKRTYKNI